MYAVAGLATFILAAPSQALRNVNVGDPVPPFSVKTVDGKTVDNVAYQGKVLLLVFVRPQQSSSEQVLETAKAILNDNRDAKLSVLALVTSRQSPEELAAFGKEHDLPFPVARDENRKLYGDLGVLVAPTTLLIDQEGILRYEQAHAPPGYDIHLRLHTDLLLGKLNQEQFESRLAEVSAEIEADA